MKLIFPLFLFTTLYSCNASSQHDSDLPEKLSKLPIGISVEHSLDTVYATVNEKDPVKYGKYKWKFETKVTALEKDLTITEFGAYLWRNNKWTFTTIYNRPFNSEEFAKWYSCENSVLIKGSSCTDTNNWSKADKLEGQISKALWYFIGTDKTGNEYFGSSVVVTIGKLMKEQMPTQPK